MKLHICILREPCFLLASENTPFLSFSSGWKRFDHGYTKFIASLDIINHFPVNRKLRLIQFYSTTKARTYMHMHWHHIYLLHIIPLRFNDIEKISPSQTSESAWMQKDYILHYILENVNKLYYTW